MSTATEQLLKDHKMIRKILEGFDVDNPRFPEILKTLQRVVVGHAWFEDEFFMPAVKTRPLIFKPFWSEVSTEHEHIGGLLALLRKTGLKEKKTLQARAITLRSLLETHFTKEEDVLFPLAEQVIGRENLAKLAATMERRKEEVRDHLPR
ncbi:MAG: hemerythrin domain-containing protein [Elusimicrobia bacterium]|nr:hemerythrin domain-containing protein [Elusimicrobiota bacterium]MBP9699073.1 hemerythrin domain-containing protein [Elusimicrobiota bacterium]